MSMRLFPTLAALAAFAPAALAAQDAIVTARAAVQTVNYTLKHDGVQKDISQVVTPLAVILPIGDRFSVDVATAYARSSVRTSGAPASTIAGLTDTQLRASYTFGEDAVVLTAGVNLPTGKSTADSAQFAAAEQIANDFLLFPIGTMGSGLAATGGIAVARPVHDWNLGAGVSFRHSTDYAPYQYGDGQKAHYQPGDELRARLGVDRTFGASHATMGATWSSFGDDKSAGAAFNTGNRLVLQGGYETTVRNVGYTLGVWNLTRTEGRRASGQTAPSENILNAVVGASFAVGGIALQPSLETRHLSRAAVAADALNPAQAAGSGQMETLGLGARWTAGLLQISPAAGYSLGSLDRTDLGGWRASLAIRLTP
jgi:hypothetical protein